MAAIISKGLNRLNKNQYRQALLDKGTKLIDPETETIHEDITLTRPSAKIVWNGISLVEVPANEPAWNVDFETGEKSLLVEGETTNAVINGSIGGWDVKNAPTIAAYSDPLGILDWEITTTTDAIASAILLPSGIKNKEVRTYSCFLELVNTVTGIWIGSSWTSAPGSMPVWVDATYNLSKGTNWAGGNFLSYSIKKASGNVHYLEFTLSGNAIDLEEYFGIRFMTHQAGQKIRIGKMQVEFGKDKASSPIYTPSVAATRAADTITSAHTPTGTQLVSSDGKFDATNDVSKVLPETGAISSYTVFDKDLTAQALTRFKSDEVFEDAP